MKLYRLIRWKSIGIAYLETIIGWCCEGRSSQGARHVQISPPLAMTDFVRGQVARD